jgi:hypothetical protein
MFGENIIGTLKRATFMAALSLLFYFLKRGASKPSSSYLQSQWLVVTVL